ncbi:MAG: methyltransferase domain-containing protein [Oscillospiraceae bacterium]|jgi:phosphatidylethanolamine/phosphatidyl-N-methylethanolamine N-methyltransferase|nr:methyltransferase domain-containing protein [Oscillospiraceae bacterium]
MTFWDEIAGVYDLAEWTNKKANAETIRQVRELVPQWSSVLDCAAGTGEFSLAAAERAGAVMCTDLSQAMLDKAEAKAGRRGITNISFLVRDMNALPDGDGTYDVVIAANVLHLLPHPEAALGELWRVTVPGGRLILPTYLQGEATPFARLLIGLYQKMGFRYQKRFTLTTYRKFLREQGLPARVTRVPGQVPVGLAVCEKPL